jgi:O-antigen/teichoic acid export membrane protein
VDKNLYKRFSSNLFFNFVFQGFGYVLLFIVNVLIGRFYGKEEYGIYAFVLNMAGILALISPLGFPTAIVRLLVNEWENQDWAKVKGLIIGSSLITCFVSFAISGVLLLVGEMEVVGNKTKTALMLSSSLLPVIALINLRKRLLQALSYLKLPIFLDNLLIPFLMLLAILAMNLESSYDIIYLYIIINILTVIFSFYIVGKSVWPKIKQIRAEYLIGKWLNTSLPMMLGSLSQILMNRSAIIVLGIYSMFSDVAVFNASLKLSMLLTFTLTSVNTLVPYFYSKASAKSDQDSEDMILSYSFRISAVWALPCFVIIILFPNWLMGLFGKSFTGEPEILIMLSFGQLINAITGSVGFNLLMSGKEKVFMKSLTIIAIIGTVLNVVFIPIYGMHAAAIITTISIIILNGWQLHSTGIFRRKGLTWLYRS